MFSLFLGVVMYDMNDSSGKDAKGIKKSILIAKTPRKAENLGVLGVLAVRLLF